MIAPLGLLFRYHMRASFIDTPARHLAVFSLHIYFEMEMPQVFQTNEILPISVHEWICERWSATVRSAGRSAGIIQPSLKV